MPIPPPSGPRQATSCGSFLWLLQLCLSLPLGSIGDRTVMKMCGSCLHRNQCSFTAGPGMLFPPLCAVATVPNILAHSEISALQIFTVLSHVLNVRSEEE